MRQCELPLSSRRAPPVVMAPTTVVIASEARQSITPRQFMDCRAALAVTRIASCSAVAFTHPEANAPSMVPCPVVMASPVVTAPTTVVIASAARQSIAPRQFMDCRAALAVTGIASCSAVAFTHPAPNAPSMAPPCRHGTPLSAWRPPVVTAPPHSRHCERSAAIHSTPAIHGLPRCARSDGDRVMQCRRFYTSSTQRALHAPLSAWHPPAVTARPCRHGEERSDVAIRKAASTRSQQRSEFARGLQQQR